MPRTKKPEASVGTIESPTIAAPIKVFSITASFKTRTLEGDRINHRYNGASHDPLLALNLTCEEPEENRGTAFPTKINLPVIATLSYGDYRFSRNLAPHVVRDIFGENKNSKLFLHLMLSKALKDELHVA